MVATGWGAGVDLLARRPSHIPDRLQESAGGARQLGVRVSRSTSPAANYHAPAGRRSKRPRVGGSRESPARFGSTKCPMTTALLGAAGIGIRSGLRTRSDSGRCPRELQRDWAREKTIAGI